MGNPKPRPQAREAAIPLRQRIRNYLHHIGTGQAHYRTMATDMGCDERRVANICHDMLKRGHLAHVWISRTEYKPGVYSLPREVVRDA